jgi:hypothetical protein
MSTATWITGRCCITKWPPDQIIGGICPDCRAEHQEAALADDRNRLELIAATPAIKPPPKHRVISREEAILTAARELSHSGATITQVIRRAGKILGKGLSTGYLSPSGGGHHLRGQVEEILGPPSTQLVGAGLGAATSWVEGLQDELAKDRHTLVQIEQDRTAVLERIQAAELLLSTLEDEPEHWEVLQGGAHAGEVA